MSREKKKKKLQNLEKQKSLLGRKMTQAVDAGDTDMARVYFYQWRDVAKHIAVLHIVLGADRYITPVDGHHMVA